MQTATDTLLTEKQNGVLTCTINRAAIRNAVDAQTMIALGDAVRACDEKSDVRVIVITGAGGAFSSGADLNAAAQMGIGPHLINILTDAYAPTLQAIRNCPWPVIAAVDGIAGGIGCDLALACDLRLASTRGAFAELFIRIGLIPDGGGTDLLPRLVGLGQAMEMVLTGETVNAQDALKFGLCSKVFPTETFASDVRDFAEKIAKQAPLSLIRSKRAIIAALSDSNY